MRLGIDGFAQFFHELQIDQAEMPQSVPIHFYPAAGSHKDTWHWSKKRPAN